MHLWLRARTFLFFVFGVMGWASLNIIVVMLPVAPDGREFQIILSVSLIVTFHQANALFLGIVWFVDYMHGRQTLEAQLMSFHVRDAERFDAERH